MEKTNKIRDIVTNVLLYFFLALCILSLAITIFAKKDSDGTAEVFGHQLRIIVSDSMDKCELTDVSDFEIKSIPLRSMVFVELVPDDPEEAYEWYSDLDEGDVLTFKYVYSTQITITHRITEIKEKEGGFEIRLAGDNKNSETNQGYQIIDTTDTDSMNYVVGKVVGQSKVFGFILSIMKEPLGLIFAIIVPCTIVIIIETIKIASVISEEKKKEALEEKEKALAESAKKDRELEELRKKLKELEGSDKK